MIEPTRTVDEAASRWWSEQTLDGHLRDTATRDPERLAIVDGDVRLDYGETSHRVQRFLGGLRRLGFQAGDVGTVELPNWWEAYVAMHALLAGGGVANPVVPIYRDREVEFILRQSTARLVVVPHRFRNFDYVEMLERILPGLERRPLVVVVRAEGPLPDGFVTFEEVLDAEPAEPAAHPAGQISLLLYTSGTTADPKGVLHSHQTLEYENRSIIELFELSDESTVFMGSPVTHITGFLFGVLMPPMLGAAVVLLDVWDAERGRELIEREQCRFTVSATPFLQGLVEVYERTGGPSALTAFACGGADVPAALVRRARTLFDATVVRIYGSSEVPSVSCGGPGDSEAIAADTDGPAIGPVECRIAGGEEVGELEVKGPETFLGYLDAGLNEAAFTADGFFRTGDLAVLGDQRSVTIRGRQKDIVIRGGENISVKEVEDLLYGHPSVQEVAIVAMPDPAMGEKACAFVVPAPGAHPTLEELCGHLREQRLAVQKLPERLELVEELPKTPSGKVQKFVLRDEIRERLAVEVG